MKRLLKFAPRPLYCNIIIIALTLFMLFKNLRQDYYLDKINKALDRLILEKEKQSKIWKKLAKF